MANNKTTTRARSKIMKAVWAKRKLKATKSATKVKTVPTVRGPYKKRSIQSTIKTPTVSGVTNTVHSKITAAKRNISKANKVAADKIIKDFAKSNYREFGI